MNVYISKQNVVNAWNLLKIGNLFGGSRNIVHLHEFVAKKHFFGDKTKVKMTQQDIEGDILTVINRKRHGSILFASDFAQAMAQRAMP